MPRSRPWTVVVEGGEELTHKLRLAGDRVTEVLPKAGQAGGDLIKGFAIRGAPGPHVIVEAGKPWNAKEVSFEIGPDKDHWYYRFFEFGVHPFEINMISKRSTRWAIDQKRSNKLGRAVLVRGRPIKSDKRAVKFGAGIFSVVDRGPMPAQPFLRDAVRGHNDAIAQKVADVFKRVLDALLESR